MKNLIGAIMALFTAFCITFTAFSWTTYDEESVPMVSVSIRGARINTDGSVSVRVYIENKGKYTAENIEIGLIMVAFSGISFDIQNCIKGMALGGGEAKRYTVKISKKKVPPDLIEADLKQCSYDILYAYTIGKYSHCAYNTVETGTNA